LVGSATNLADGRVEVVVEGPRADCDRLLALLRGRSRPSGGERTKNVPPGRVDGVVERFDEARGDCRGFVER
jgi:acylphosphatase